MAGDKKERVFLIVEPGQLALSTRKLILEAAGYNVISSVSGKQGLKLWQEHAVDAAVIDTITADIPLDSLISRFQKRKVPVFLLADQPWAPDRVKVKVQGIVQKLADPKELVVALANHFGDELAVARF